MILRLIGILLLAIVGLVGLGMSLCGGAITWAGFTEAGHHGEFQAAGMRIISVPSLVIGLAILVGAGGQIVRMLRRKPGDRGDRNDSAAE
jgi:hypothetical protein